MDATILLAMLGWAAMMFGLIAGFVSARYLNWQHGPKIFRPLIDDKDPFFNIDRAYRRSFAESVMRARSSNDKRVRSALMIFDVSQIIGIAGIALVITSLLFGVL